MNDRYWHPDIECAPLPELVARMEARLEETDVFVRAMRSPLYHERWQAAGIDPAAIRSYADLQYVPYTGPAELRLVQEKHPPDELVCSDRPPRYWISTSGSTGVPKWVPVGGKDLERNTDIGHRLSFFPAVPFKDEDVVFSVVAPAPFITDTGIWSGYINHLKGMGPPDAPQLESITFSFETGVEGMAMALKRKVNVFFAFPSLVMRIAEGLSTSAPVIARQRLQEKLNLENLLAFLITRVRKIRARDIVKVHTAILGGEPLGPYRQAMYDAWGIRYSYNIYTFSEYGVALAECYAQEGMHVWIDASLPEIIMQADLEREREEPGYIPPARPLWEAQPGDEGELVLTHFGDAFPLIRWRTADLIQVAGIGPCRCGRTHPRINILQRSDDLVNLGIVRFSTFSLKEKLDAITRPAAVARWQLRVGRQGYKPLLTILVRPAAPVDEAQMIASVRAAVGELEVLRRGWENDLISEPVVRIVPDLGDRLSSSGKLRPLVYETNPEEVNA